MRDDFSSSRRLLVAGLAFSGALKVIPGLSRPAAAQEIMFRPDLLALVDKLARMPRDRVPPNEDVAATFESACVLFRKINGDKEFASIIRKATELKLTPLQRESAERSFASIEMFVRDFLAFEIIAIREMGASEEAMRKILENIVVAERAVGARRKFSQVSADELFRWLNTAEKIICDKSAALRQQVADENRKNKLLSIFGSLLSGVAIIAANCIIMVKRPLEAAGAGSASIQIGADLLTGAFKPLVEA